MMREPVETKEEQQLYSNGFKARKQCLFRDSNPHKVGSREYGAWEYGYDMAHGMLLPLPDHYRY